MGLAEQIQKDMVEAMRARQEPRLSTLRMVKSALKNKEIEKRGPLEEKEVLAVLGTLIKQRKDSVEQFTKGNRPELAEKESQEIKIIEGYLPQAASVEEITATVRAVIGEMGAPTLKDMGTVMKNAMAKFAAGDVRADGKLVSEVVKRELSPKQ